MRGARSLHTHLLRDDYRPPWNRLLQVLSERRTYYSQRWDLSPGSPTDSLPASNDYRDFGVSRYGVCDGVNGVLGVYGFIRTLTGTPHLSLAFIDGMTLRSSSQLPKSEISARLRAQHLHATCCDDGRRALLAGAAHDSGAGDAQGGAAAGGVPDAAGDFPGVEVGAAGGGVGG